MSISDKDIKLLWGRAAGICSNPICQCDLTRLLEASSSYVIGEMAHVVAKSSGGPRGRDGVEDNSYSNLILLCPTCHRDIDKAPVECFPPDMLLGWKREHEERIRLRGQDLKFNSFSELRSYISRLLIENKSIWIEYGPRSDIAKSSPGSNAYELWEYRKLSTIVPNNNSIIRVIEGNASLLNDIQYRLFIQFKSHAKAFERHQYAKLDTYPLFPVKFSEVFGDAE